MKNLFVLVAFMWFAAILGGVVANTFIEFVIYGGASFAVGTGTICYMALKGI